ncbi:ATP synthase F0 subunit A [Paenibacillus sambharensis]|uniref:ATP synthase subunit a n=1 Tax=Paenibacillus sambharensis TaxID=1803190 RepID=A0A2W1M1J3_9BACL|nr:F0F1 ATP synthase subunit A [Paenibacillus sambharensis]PZD97781.1 ATP synthase F0 subunit A [Paenibacillus sambharensis]
MHLFPVIEVGGFHLDLSTILALLVSCTVVFVLARVAVSNLSVHNPSRMQNFLEWVVDFVHNLVASAMPLEKAKKFIALGMTLIMFIFVSNVLGLPFGIVTEHHHETKIFGYTYVTDEMVAEHDGHAHVAWWKSPTADIMVTLGLAVVVFFLIHYLGFTQNRKHYIKHYFQPFWFFFPLNLLEQVARPITLAVRLYANIFAGELLIATILMLGFVGFPLLAVWQGFSIFVGAIQAFLFTILTMVYISQAIVHEDHDDDH